jgi:hypothetical protein
MLRAIIFVTINDYLALFTLSGQFTGKVGCVVCIYGTAYMSLTASKISTSTITLNYSLLLHWVTVKAKEFST